VNDDNGEFKQNFNNCHFNSQLKFYAVGNNTKVNCSITGCTFEISNSGTPIEAIHSVGSYATESQQNYTIEGNIYLGDAYLLPTRKATFRLTSSTDGSTTPVADWDVSVGDISNLGPVANNTFEASATKLSDYSFAASKIFHFGIMDNYVVKAKPLTQVTQFYHGQGDYSQILPISDCMFIVATTQTASKAIYHVIGDSLSAPYDFSTFLPTIVWWVEIEKM
jgi:hypothetical protein